MAEVKASDPLAAESLSESRPGGVPLYSTEFVRAMRADPNVANANRVPLFQAAQVDRETALGVRLVPAVINGYRQLQRRFESIECVLLELKIGQEEIGRRMGALERRLAPSEQGEGG